MELMIGQSLWYETQKRTIKRLLKNNKGAQIIEWESRHNVGVVLPSVWIEWKANVNPNVRRVASQCVCEPKPKNRSGIPFAKKRY